MVRLVLASCHIDINFKDKSVLVRSLDSVMKRVKEAKEGKRSIDTVEIERGECSKMRKVEKFKDLCGWCLNLLPSDQALLCGSCQVVYYCDREHQGKAWKLHKKVCGKLGKAGGDRKKDILAKHFTEMMEMIQK